MHLVWGMVSKVEAAKPTQLLPDQFAGAPRISQERDSHDLQVAASEALEQESARPVNVPLVTFLLTVGSVPQT